MLSDAVDTGINGYETQCVHLGWQSSDSKENLMSSGVPMCILHNFNP